MKKQPWCSFQLCGLSLTDYGLSIPSPFVSLELSNSEISSMTSWTLRCTVGGDNSKKVNVAAFEALLYSAAQESESYVNSAGVPVSFSFGWLDEYGNVDSYLSYQGFTLLFKVTTNGLYMNYTVEGYASLALQSSSPVIQIPELSGIVQPSAVLEALAIGVKATSYYQLDIDHNDAPTLVSHGAMSTSFNQYVRGSYSTEDDYSSFPGLLKLSKSYSGSRDAGGLNTNKGVTSLNQVLKNATVTPIEEFLKMSNTDTTPQCSSFSYWVDEPTMTQPGVIHYKSNSGLLTSQVSDTLQYGTANSNILSLSGQYNGVAYSMTDMNFSQLGFSLDASGNSIINDSSIVNSWSASLPDVFKTSDIINDVHAVATQFSGEFTVQIAGSVKEYTVAQPISLLVMTGNTLSPVSGVYNIVSVTHTIGETFITTLKIQRMMLSTANQVASGQGIYVYGSSSYPSNSYGTTANVISTSKVDFGVMYPTFEDLYVL